MLRRRGKITRETFREQVDVASAALMELSCYLRCMSMKAFVEWSLRAGNRMANVLANGDNRSVNLPPRDDTNPKNIKPNTCNKQHP